MVYDLVFNAVKQALQLQAPAQMNNRDLGELLGTLYFLEKIKISADKRDFIEKQSILIEQEIFKRRFADIIVILFHADADLSAMIAELPEAERLEFLEWLEKYDIDFPDQEISAEERTKIKECLASF